MDKVNLTGEIWKEMGLQQMLENLDTMFPDIPLSMEKLLEMLIAGNLQGAVGELLAAGRSIFSINWLSLRQLLLSLIFMGIVSAVFVRFADFTPKYRVGELCFFFVYLLQASVLTRCFSYFWGIADTLLDNMVTFIRMLMPFFLLAVSLATGTVTAGAGCQLLLLLVYGIETVVKEGFLALITLFFLFSILEGLEASDRWENLLDLLKKGADAGRKAIFAGASTLGIVQAILTPAIDSLKGTAMERILTSLPGVGNGAESVMKMLVGSAMVIKNAVGILLAFLLGLLCFMPLVKILALSVILKLAAAIMGLVSDKRLTRAVDRAGETGFLFFRVTGCAMALFWLAIAATSLSIRI